MVDVVNSYCHGAAPQVLYPLIDTAVLALGAMSHNRLVRHDDCVNTTSLARNVLSVAGLFGSEAKWTSSEEFWVFRLITAMGGLKPRCC